MGRKAIGIVLLVAAAGVGVYFLWPRKAAGGARPLDAGKGTPSNPIDRYTGSVADLTGAVNQTSKLVDQLEAFGANIGDLFGGGDSKSAGKNSTQAVDQSNAKVDTLMIGPAASRGVAA